MKRLLLLVVFIVVSAQSVTAQTPTPYKTYLGFIKKNPGLHGQGVASVSGGQYQQQLNASWYYVWGWWCGNNSNCINMLRNGESVAPSCKQYIMLFNEPNSVEPYGHTILPEDAAVISQSIRAQCPGSWLIIGNLVAGSYYGITGMEWLTRYFAAGGAYDQIGLHAYVSPNGSVAQALAPVDAILAAFPGKQFCLTEFNTFNRQTQIFSDLVYEVRVRFDCFAAFTDRDPNWQQGYGTNLDMINANGTRNAYGDIYAGQ